MIQGRSMIVKTTYHGEIEVPDEVSDKARYWAEILFDRIRAEELYGLIQLLINEERAFGYYHGLFDGARPVLDEAAKGTEGGAWPTSDEREVLSVYGRDQESTERERVHEAEVAKGNWD
jgi:hypothetical protein